MTAMSIILNMFLNPPPLVKVTECTLTSDVVNHNGKTFLKFTIRATTIKFSYNKGGVVITFLYKILDWFK